MRRMVLILVAALAAAPLAALPAKATEQTDVMATVKKGIDSFNKADKNAWVATCAAQVGIVDDFPPHAWQGATACADWWNDLDAFNKRNGIAGQNVALGEPRHVEVTGDRAYVVVPTTLTYKQKGQPATEAGALMTLALQKESAGWRITGWAWVEGH